jgi:hypothetical protein
MAETVKKPMPVMGSAAYKALVLREEIGGAAEAAPKPTKPNKASAKKDG